MKKEEIISALGEAGVDTSLTGEGEIRADLLELALNGTKVPALLDELKKEKERADKAETELGTAKTEITAYETTTKTLNNRITELEKQKTPEGKANVVVDRKSKKEYVLTLPKSRFAGKDVTAEILNEDQELLHKLIKSKSPVLQEKK